MRKHVLMLALLALLCGSCAVDAADCHDISVGIGNRVLTYTVPYKDEVSLDTWSHKARLFGTCWKQNRGVISPLQGDLAALWLDLEGSKFSQVLYLWGSESKDVVVKESSILIDEALYGILISKDNVDMDQTEETVRYLEIAVEIDECTADRLASVYPNVAYINYAVASKSSVCARLSSKLPVKYIHWGFTEAWAGRNEYMQAFATTAEKYRELWMPWFAEYYKALEGDSVEEYVSVLWESEECNKFIAGCSARLKGIDFMTYWWWLSIDKIVANCGVLNAFVYRGDDYLDTLPRFADYASIRYYYGRVTNTWKRKQGQQVVGFEPIFISSNRGVIYTFGRRAVDVSVEDCSAFDIEVVPQAIRIRCRELRLSDVKIEKVSKLRIIEVNELYVNDMSQAAWIKANIRLIVCRTMFVRTGARGVIFNNVDIVLGGVWFEWIPTLGIEHYSYVSRCFPGEDVVYFLYAYGKRGKIGSVRVVPVDYSWETVQMRDPCILMYAVSYKTTVKQGGQ